MVRRFKSDLGAIAGILLALLMMCPASLDARTIRLRSGDHADFSRLVLPAAGQGWRVEAADEGFALVTDEDDLSFDSGSVFDLITRERLRDLRDEGAGRLVLDTSQTMTPKGYYYGDAYIIDIGPDTAPRGADSSAKETPGPTPVEPDTPLRLTRSPLADKRRDTGGINGLSELGPAAARSENGLHPVESALLFQVARAASDGTLQVADAELLSRRRAEAEAQKAPHEHSPAETEERASHTATTASLDCEQASALLTFEPAPPKDRAEAEAAYLEHDGERSNSRVIAMAKGFMALGLFRESARILDLAPNNTAEVALLRDIASLQADDRIDASRLDAVIKCGATTELWRLAAPEPAAIRSEPYALFTAFVALPPMIRAALKPRFIAELSARGDAAAQTLLLLISQAPTPCHQTLDCSDPMNERNLLEEVKALATAGSEQFAQDSQGILDALMGTKAEVPPSLPLYLQAIAYERSEGEAGLNIRLSSIMAYTHQGNFDAAFKSYVALSQEDKGHSKAGRAINQVAEAFVAKADDELFLELAFRHGQLIRECCEKSYADLLTRLQGFGFDEDALSGAGTHLVADHSASGGDQITAHDAELGNSMQRAETTKKADVETPAAVGAPVIDPPPAQSGSQPALDDARRLVTSTADIMAGLRAALAEGSAGK